MYVIGQKVKIVRGVNKGKRGIITYAGMDGAWYNIRTNKGKDIKLQFENTIKSR